MIWEAMIRLVQMFRVLQMSMMMTNMYYVVVLVPDRFEIAAPNFEEPEVEDSSI